MTSRPFAFALATNRVLFGVRFIAQPTEAGKVWIGERAARRSQTHVFARALGARDLALGLGALQALQQRDVAAIRTWMAAHAISDGTDLVATFLAKDDVPRKAFLFATGMAAVSTAIAVGSAASAKSASA